MINQVISVQNLKIIFFGTSDFAVPILKALFKNGYNVAAVITTPDEPAGRKQILTPPPVKLAAQQLDLKILQPPSLKIENLKFKISCDIGIVASYGKIIPSQYLEMSKYGFLNVHPSLLPKYRGPSPIQTAILKNDPETGLTIIKLDEEIDHGPIIAAKRQETRDKYYKELEQELAEIGAKLLIETLPKYINGEIEPIEQEHGQATFTKKITRQDGQIDWNKTAEEIYNQVRALNPKPGTWTMWRNKVLNIKTATEWCPSSDLGWAPSPPGSINKVNNSIAVVTKTCYLILKQIQLEGGKEMDAKAFLNGHPDFLGSKLE